MAKIPENQSIAISKVSETLGVASYSLVTLCRSDAINRYARCKPYAFGGTLGGGGMTEAVRKANNYGMTPKLIQFPQYPTASTAAPQTLWGQWRVPTGKRKDDTNGQYEDEPCRLGDFRGYNHGAVGAIKHVKIYSSAGEGYTKPIAYNSDYHGAMGYLIAEAEIDTAADLPPSMFHRPDGTELSLGEMHLTLVLASVDPGSGQNMWIAQSPRNLSESGPRCTAMMVTTEFDFDGMPLVGGEPANVVMTGLYPKIEGLADDGSAHYESDVLKYMVSLDMWGDAPVRHYAFNDDIAVFGSGGAGATVEVQYYRVLCKLLYVPPVELWKDDNGAPQVVIKGATKTAFVQWYDDGGAVDDSVAPNDACIYVSVELLRGGVQAYAAEFKIEDYDAFPQMTFVDDKVLTLEGFPRDDGTYTARVTYTVEARRTSGIRRPQVRDKDNPSNIVQAEVTATGTITYP